MSLDDRFDDFLREYRDNRSGDKEFQGSIKNFVEAAEKRLDSHANSIRALQSWRNFIVGGAAAIGGLIGIKFKDS